MTDYLTELLRPEEDALERAIRRVENALAGGSAKEAGAEEELSPGEEAARADPEAERLEAVRSFGERAGLPLVLPRESTQEERNAALRGGTEEGFSPEFAQPLAGALQKADRSAAQADVLTRGAAAPQSTGDRTAEDRAWTTMGRAEPGQTAAGGELETAQRVDRAFRRDSRRYDGGFFLY